MAFGRRHAFAAAGERSIEGAVATAGIDERMAFVKKTYAHLGVAIGLFVLLSYVFIFQMQELSFRWTQWALSGNWLIVLGAYMLVGWLAQKWAQSDTSRGVQYLGFALFLVIEVVIFTPLLYVAAFYAKDPYLIQKAGVITLLAFGGLTGTVFITKKDFSFLGGALGIAAMIALGVIVASMLFGFSLGTLFSVLMVGLASGYVLYYTSQVLAHYRPTQYVAAALALFATIALLFWYILQLLMSLNRN